jgi:hypothetical protein
MIEAAIVGETVEAASIVDDESRPFAGVEAQSVRQAWRVAANDSGAVRMVGRRRRQARLAEARGEVSRSRYVPPPASSFTSSANSGRRERETSALQVDSAPV